MGRAVGFVRSNLLVAGVTYVGYNGTNVWTGVASEDPGWLNRANLWAVFAYPFSQLKVQRITALVDAGNTRSIRFVEHLGFTLEATLDRAAPDGRDQFVYRMRAEECRWLHDLRYRGEQRERWAHAASAGLPGARATAGSTQH